MDEPRTCAKCGQRPPGAGGILCPACLVLLAEQARDYWGRPPVDSGQPDARD